MSFVNIKKATRKPKVAEAIRISFSEYSASGKLSWQGNNIKYVNQLTSGNFRRCRLFPRAENIGVSSTVLRDSRGNRGRLLIGCSSFQPCLFSGDRRTCEPYVIRQMDHQVISVLYRRLFCGWTQHGSSEVRRVAAPKIFVSRRALSTPLTTFLLNNAENTEANLDVVPRALRQLSSSEREHFSEVFSQLIRLCGACDRKLTTLWGRVQSASSLVDLLSHWWATLLALTSHWRETAHAQLLGGGRLILTTLNVALLCNAWPEDARLTQRTPRTAHHRLGRGAAAVPATLRTGSPLAQGAPALTDLEDQGRGPWRGLFPRASFLEGRSPREDQGGLGGLLRGVGPTTSH
ncbi:hypothetical protein PR048_030322 [Dryococelus australis]|uniref:Uncharacterized protein n=1 Tax=Dryococelus australis TaxID=614101 RepID=A0ABQ9GBD5_9NEOP|nr:hypothetical protein PR048_030322 [Dryococelus australis]